MLGSPEILPATQTAAVQLVLLHGWGCDREIWRSMVACLRPWADVTLIDVPGCAPAVASGNELEFEDVLDMLLAAAPERAVFVGWSLGGQFALALAARAPERVLAVVTLCSNPKFVADAQWPGVPAAVFDEFQNQFHMDADATLRRFRKLQTQGAKRPLSLLRRLTRAGSDCSESGLAFGLHWLLNIDHRPLLLDLATPQLHLLAERDALVPLELHQRLAALLVEKEQTEVLTIPDASHLTPLDSSQRSASLIKRFLDARGLCLGEATQSEAPAKMEVASSFSRAAQSYDTAAALQREVGERLLSILESQSKAYEQVRTVETVLDLGCGTGHFRPQLCSTYPTASYIGVDIAEGMISYARDRCKRASSWLVGDAESLPLAAASCDIVFSSLALQWCYRPEAYLAELARVLKPGGLCLFSTLGPDTLCELRRSWEAVDAYQHVNRFLEADLLQAAAASIPDISVTIHCERYCMHYDRVAELLAELKTLGAHNMNRGRATGLTSRTTLLGMLQAYEQWRQDGLLPATYEVIFVEVTKG